MSIPDGYLPGLGRDYPHPPLAHLYKGTMADPGLPMCRYGWNRGDGYSIWRNNVGRKGVCKVCLRRAQQGLDGVPYRAPRTEADTERSGVRADGLAAEGGAPKSSCLRTLESEEAA